MTQKSTLLANFINLTIYAIKPNNRFYWNMVPRHTNDTTETKFCQKEKKGKEINRNFDDKNNFPTARGLHSPFQENGVRGAPAAPANRSSRRPRRRPRRRRRASSPRRAASSGRAPEEELIIERLPRESNEANKIVSQAGGSKVSATHSLLVRFAAPTGPLDLLPAPLPPPLSLGALMLLLLLLQDSSYYIHSDISS